MVFDFSKTNGRYGMLCSVSFAMRCSFLEKELPSVKTPELTPGLMGYYRW